jgi:hypothetical protein
MSVCGKTNYKLTEEQLKELDEIVDVNFYEVEHKDGTIERIMVETVRKLRKPKKTKGVT